MQMTDEVKKALKILRDNATNDFEHHRIDVLERDLINPPKIEIVDDKHQRFLGISFRKRKEGHYFTPMLSIYRAVWFYHYGELPPNTIIHHIDHNKDNNDVSNLLPMLPNDHRKHHTKDGCGKSKLPVSLTCSICGKVYNSFYNGRNHYCSDCQQRLDHERRLQKEKARRKKKTAEKREQRLREPYHGSGIRQCTVCGEAYYYDARNSKRKTCSDECEKTLRKQKAEKRKVDRSRICPVCGEQFKYKHKCQKTYSPECGRILTLQAVKARPLKRVISHCELCGKKIEHRPSETPRFCSRDCVYKYMAKVNTKNEHVSQKEVRTCICCGKTFEVCKKAAKQWCSPECRQKLNMKSCPICGKQFYSKKLSQQCCSKTCARKLRILKYDNTPCLRN